jgi:superfamily I DNA/RNA helicase
MMKLDTEKLVAIEHTGSPLIITAGPGSGNTRVITERIKFQTLWNKHPI